MTQQLDAARGVNVVARWCALAEARLEHLTELFESGRWRRYHSELSFLENIQEAKAAVQTWRQLSGRETNRDNTAIDLSWLGRAAATLQRDVRLRDNSQWSQPAASSARPEQSMISIVPAAGPVLREEAAEVRTPDNAWKLTRDIAEAIAERYPVLRNTL